MEEKGAWVGTDGAGGLIYASGPASSLHHLSIEGCMLERCRAHSRGCLAEVPGGARHSIIALLIVLIRIREASVGHRLLISTVQGAAMLWYRHPGVIASCHECILVGDQQRQLSELDLCLIHDTTCARSVLVVEVGSCTAVVMNQVHGGAMFFLHGHQQ